MRSSLFDGDKLPTFENCFLDVDGGGEVDDAAAVAISTSIRMDRILRWFLVAFVNNIPTL